MASPEEEPTISKDPERSWRIAKTSGHAVLGLFGVYVGVRNSDMVEFAAGMTIMGYGVANIFYTAFPDIPRPGQIAKNETELIAETPQEPSSANSDTGI